jgi:hypothetical protein
VLPLEKGALPLVFYWSATRIIMSIKVKVIEGGLCAYGWVTILLYCLWKNEHIPLFLTISTSGVSSEEEEIFRAQHLDLIYSQFGILYEIIPDASRLGFDPSKMKSVPHFDGNVGFVKALPQIWL